MTDQIRLRKATLNDLDVLRSFEQGVINAERPFDPTIKSGIIHYYDLETMISDKKVAIMVAEYVGEIIASGYARIMNAKAFYIHQEYAYLGFMYVHPNFRGKGINRVIIEALKQWASSQGVTEIRLEVYAKNEAAIKAYEKTGFTQHIIEMRMSL